MTYLLASALLIVLVLLAFFSPRFRKFRKEHEKMVDFISSLCATFVGVFLAMYLSKFEDEKTAADKSITLLRLSLVEVMGAEETVRSFRDIYRSYPHGVIRLAVSLEALPYPHVLEKTLRDNDVLTHVSEVSASFLNKMLSDLERAKSSLKAIQAVIAADASGTGLTSDHIIKLRAKIDKAIVDYATRIVLCRSILEKEISFQRKEINIEMLKSSQPDTVSF